MPENSSNTPMRPLSADAFIRALHGQTVDDENGEEVCFLIDKDIIVENIKVLEEVYIIKNRDFKNSISIINSIFSKFTIADCEFCVPINFQKCLFIDEFYIYGGIFYKEIKINYGKFKKNFEIFDIECHCELTINNCLFKQISSIGKGKFDSLTLNKCIFNNNFFILEGAFDSYVSITGGIFRKTIFVVNSVFNKEFCIGEKNQIKTINLYGGIFKEAFCIKDGICNQIQIQHSEMKEIEILSSFIGEFSCLTDIKYLIQIQFTRINHLGIYKRLKSSGSLYLKNLSLNQLSFESFENEGRISITDVKSGGVFQKNLDTDEIIETPAPSSFQILNSDMGNVSFFNMDFESFDTIIIKDSKLNEIKTINKHLPTSKEQKIYANDGKEQNFHFLEELYNHLYFAMQKQGNRTQEIKYYAEYLEFHRKNKLGKLKSTNQSRISNSSSSKLFPLLFTSFTHQLKLVTIKLSAHLLKLFTILLTRLDDVFLWILIIGITVVW